MKTYLFSFTFLLALLPFHLFAQGDREDVIHMKNGSIYRGTIVEQIPGVSYKIEIAGGSVIEMKAGEVTKITKEDRIHDQSRGPDEVQYNITKPTYEFKFRPKGYFFLAQLENEALEFGFRILNGYKFGRFGFLGVGVGVDGVVIDLHGSQDYGGAYFPFFIHYGGDILKKKTTPFYSLEAGYALHFAPLLSPQNLLGDGSGVTSAKGGMMGGVGFGVRFYSKRRAHFDLSAHVDFKQASATVNSYSYDQYGNQVNYYYNESTILIIPGLRFGIGF